MLILLKKWGGYSLVCYSGNAFFIRNDCIQGKGLKEITPVAAYLEFVENLNETERLWLYWVNLALVPPYYKYKNKYLSRCNLKLPLFKTFYSTIKTVSLNSIKGKLHSVIETMKIKKK